MKKGSNEFDTESYASYVTCDRPEKPSLPWTDNMCRAGRLSAQVPQKQCNYYFNMACKNITT